MKFKNESFGIVFKRLLALIIIIFLVMNEYYKFTIILLSISYTLDLLVRDIDLYKDRLEKTISFMKREVDKKEHTKINKNGETH